LENNVSTGTIEINSQLKLEMPQLPSSALRVAKLTRDPNSSTKMIADAIGCDPVLAARILRAVNSPLYSMERRVTSLPVAINALGMRGVHQLVMSYAAADTFNQSGKPSLEERTLWKHSLAVGLAAREVAKAAKLRAMDDAFLCGLMHDIGKLLLIRNDSETYKEIIEITDETLFLKRETLTYGFTHSQIGARVASQWGLAEEIISAILHHHDPGQATEFMSIARVIDVADQLANSADIGLRYNPDHDMTISESVISLDLSEEQLADIWDSTEAALEEMMRAMSSVM
jgi:putative nucleotidyltransferase with HDIG domain